MGRLTCVKQRVGFAPTSRLSEAGKDAVAGHERVTGRPWRRIRDSVMKRDCGMCVLCLAAERYTLAVEVDHIEPVWRGGSPTDEDNLQSLCDDCHKAKTAREAGERAAT